MPGAPRFRRTRFHAASRFRRSQICPHRLCHLRRFSSFFKPDAPVPVRISSAPAALGVFPAGSSLDSLCLLMRPSSFASPSVPPPFAPSSALLEQGGPVHFQATGHAALPALPHYYGFVCHLPRLRAPISISLIWTPTGWLAPPDPDEASPRQCIRQLQSRAVRKHHVDGFVKYVPSPPSCRLGILRLADRFTLPPSEAIRYGPGPRLRLPRPHLTVGALPPVSENGG